ncbi:MAG: Thiamine-phosphate synthase [candidate division Zixibacteria bacterium RBG-1]|nr:MAG: Thiamine-phosphate synthase [candidate division Zixibacteria bacterium RBG-1]OGC83901.1 MAG: thiamine-phosphate diphosphorylase [candidate division Zixibacteria bacterium RBG_19FT_COMBO_42_43]
MNKKEILKKAQLYVLVDKKLIGERKVEDVTSQLVKSGVQMIQYRDKYAEDGEFLKEATKIKKILKNQKVLLIINDRVDIALFIDADGVHVGQNDLPVPVARKLLGKNKIIGTSAENIKKARTAQKQGADYVGLGPIFYTTTKERIPQPVGLGLIRQAKKELKIPFFPIGGINLDNLGSVINAGAKRVAVASAIICSPNISDTTREFINRLKIS